MKRRLLLVSAIFGLFAWGPAPSEADDFGLRGLAGPQLAHPHDAFQRGFRHGFHEGYRAGFHDGASGRRPNPRVHESSDDDAFERGFAAGFRKGYYRGFERGQAGAPFEPGERPPLPPVPPQAPVPAPQPPVRPPR